MQKIRILKDVYLKIISQYPIVPPEQGGIIGGNDRVVNRYFHDSTRQSVVSAVYSPNIKLLNSKIEEWHKKDISFLGLVHSHPKNQITLSNDDVKYIELLFHSLPNEARTLYFPVFIPQTKELFSYRVKRSNSGLLIQSDNIEIML